MVETTCAAKSCKSNSLIDKHLHLFRFPNTKKQRTYNLTVESCKQQQTCGWHDTV